MFNLQHELRLCFLVTHAQRAVQSLVFAHVVHLTGSQNCSGIHFQHNFAVFEFRFVSSQPNCAKEAKPHVLRNVEYSLHWFRFGVLFDKMPLRD